MNDLKGIIEDCNKSDLVSDKVIKKVIEIIGQEKWQDLHDENNDICTTMGELIITLKGIADLEKENAVLERRIERAKECMKKLLFIINSDPANYNCKGLVQDAEDFIYNRTCNIRQQGEHCISETRCIMCDK